MWSGQRIRVARHQPFAVGWTSFLLVVISGIGDWFAQEKWLRQRRVRSIRAQRVFGCLRGLARIDQRRQALLQIRSEAKSNLG
jgi:hypothetical protein